MPRLKILAATALRQIGLRGLPTAAEHATIAGMSWHHVPKDDA
jgi:hypothetical protein